VEGLSNNIVGDLEETTGCGWRREAAEADCADIDDTWTVAGCKTATGSSAVDAVRQDQNWLCKQSIGDVGADRIENSVVCLDEDTEAVQRVRTLNVDCDDQMSTRRLTWK
jgi:hypothetical protein